MATRDVAEEADLSGVEDRPTMMRIPSLEITDLIHVRDAGISSHSILLSHRLWFSGEPSGYRRHVNPKAMGLRGKEIGLFYAARSKEKKQMLEKQSVSLFL